MSAKIEDGGPATCAWCARPYYIRQGRIRLCAVHYRISSMRARAQRDGKKSPTVAQIEALVPSPFVCVGCARPMNWLHGDGRSTQVTLQHDRSGELRLICLACNTRHAQHPEDSYYTIQAGHKRCPDCEQHLPHAAFAKDRSRPIGLKSYCRACSSIRHKSWEASRAVA